MTYIFDGEIAKEYGVLEAILLGNMAWWIEKNRANGKHFHDGLYWTYNSTKALNELYPFYSQRQIQYALQHLKDDGIIVVGNYNKDKRDRTLWYAVSDAGREKIKNCKMQSAVLLNANVENVEALPDINTTDKKTTDKENTINILSEKKEEEIKESSKEKINKKKSSSANSDAIISETIQSGDFSEDVKNALTDFVQNRKELKNPVTSLGIKRLLSKLHSLSSDEAEQIEIINQSIERGYSGLFPVHQGMAQGYSTKNNSFISREKQIEMLNRLTESDINNYCREKNYSHVSASEFLGNYRKRNWMVGNSVITDWKSAVDEWEARELKRIKDKEDEEYKIYHRSYMTRCLNDKL